jgi:hypothetical protein
MDGLQLWRVAADIWNKQKLTNDKGLSPPTERWRKLHNEELRDFYSSPNIIRET